MQKALIIIGVIVGLGLFSYADGWRHLEGLFNAIGFVFVCAAIAYGCWLGIQHFIINKISSRYFIFFLYHSRRIEFLLNRRIN